MPEKLTLRCMVVGTPHVYTFEVNGTDDASLFKLLVDDKLHLEYSPILFQVYLAKPGDETRDPWLMTTHEDYAALVRGDARVQDEYMNEHTHMRGGLSVRRFIRGQPDDDEHAIHVLVRFPTDEERARWDWVIRNQKPAPPRVRRTPAPTPAPSFLDRIYNLLCGPATSSQLWMGTTETAAMKKEV